MANGERRTTSQNENADGSENADENENEFARACGRLRSRSFALSLAAFAHAHAHAHVHVHAPLSTPRFAQKHTHACPPHRASSDRRRPVRPAPARPLPVLRKRGGPGISHPAHRWQRRPMSPRTHERTHENTPWSAVSVGCACARHAPPPSTRARPRRNAPSLRSGDGEHRSPRADLQQEALLPLLRIRGMRLPRKKAETNITPTTTTKKETQTRRSRAQHAHAPIHKYCQTAPAAGVHSCDLARGRSLPLTPNTGGGANGGELAPRRRRRPPSRRDARAICCIIPYGGARPTASGTLHV
ncbi:hypothetical protein BC628DRAFT_666383 [Trametes gibbosa]|nr:hypothetical protein BC628DRAFT_666383 [Trametes gibbosa]